MYGVDSFLAVECCSRDNGELLMWNTSVAGRLKRTREVDFSVKQWACCLDCINALCLTYLRHNTVQAQCTALTRAALCPGVLTLLSMIYFSRSTDMMENGKLLEGLDT